MNNTFDQNTMTGREVKDMQAVSDGPEDAGNAWALYWIAKRREDKSFTYDQALDVSIGEVTAYLGLDNPLAQS